MDAISALFDRMDAWRHLPSYQLERRADLFFSLYLPEALEAKLGFAVQRDLVPEFPIRIGTIYPNIPINKSFKIDYLALSADSEKAVFVELKTEGLSRRSEQDKYLRTAKDVGLDHLLEGVLDIFRATTAKRKYFCLLQRLAGLGLLEIPQTLSDLMAGGNLQGVAKASKDVKVSSRARECLVVYVQPNGAGKGIISFDEFRAVVECHTDPLSVRFAQSLTEWARAQAGTPKVV